MRLIDLLKLPEERNLKAVKDNHDYLQYDKGYNHCLSEIRKLNEGVELVVDEGEVEKIAKEIYEEYGKNNGGWVCSWEELAQRHKDFDKYLVSKSLDKWLVRKEK